MIRTRSEILLPFNITIDEPFVDELAELITMLAIGGLLHAAERQG